MADVLDKEMYAYFMRLSEAEKKSVVEMLKAFLRGRNEDTSRINIEQYNKEIDEAIEEVKRGETFSHEEVIKMSKDW